MGEAQFTQELNGLLTHWLVDPVFSVRDAAAATYRRPSEVLGLPWCEANIVPQLQNLLTHKNYLYRISAMLCAGTLADLAGGSLLDKQLVPMVVKMSSDP